MRHDYSRIPTANIPRSTFNLSHSHKTTFDAGFLVPHFIQEVVPGDTHSVTCHKVVRLATPIKPIMDHISIEDFYFFVPNRLVWDNWVKFMGEQEDPGDSTDFLVPTKTSAVGYSIGSLADYFGLPVLTANTTHNVLPMRMYNLIWREWFRSQDLQNSPAISKADGPDTTTDAVLLRRGKRHDYFTSCLPWPQFGPGVDIPLGVDAPIFTTAATGEQAVARSGITPGQSRGLVPDTLEVQWSAEGPFSPETNIFADLSGASAATINELRQAFAIQKLQERDARGGHRYQELVLSHFGVRGGDARLNRPEYLGGSTVPMGVVQIPQTSGTATDPATGYTAEPQGNLAAYGIATGSGGFTKSFTEHGYIIGLINARADLTYQRGLDRHWSRSTKYDFYWPALCKIGEQAVKNGEIYYQGTAADDDIFGYQERWSEMRFTNSRLTGLFRSNAPASLDVWHLSQDFAALPALNADFIQDDPPIDRVIAVPDEPHFIADFYFKHRAVRPMPINSAPGYIDHF